jgi:hypothetical protein
MYESLGKAAAATGLSRSTILRAIKSHRISAAKTDTGDWEIQAAELHRVFPPAQAAQQAMTRGATAPEQAAIAVLEAQIAGLKELAEVLRRQLDDVRADRDHWREAHSATQRLLPGPTPEDALPAHWPRPWWRRLTG